MQVFVRFLIICLLEQDIGADASFFEPAVIFDGGRRDVDVDAADRAVFMLDTIDGFNAFQHIFDRAVDRVLARFQRKALVPHVLERDHLAYDILL